jgi:adenine-specific DNA-methyltransferase
MEERLDMQSPNWVNENCKFIAERFPNCITETADGIKIDFDLLQQELSADIIEGSKERYRLEWPGKREAIVTANLPTTKTLRPVREDSVDFDNTENLYIEGDNLEVLKLLQESYLGKIKMIYIDPPYNTGNDFVYKDNFSKDAQEELFESGQKDEYNQRLVSNPETAGRYHSDWLSMMYPRLKLARNLLTYDGIIFISIDDNEIRNLKILCDEIFGEFNFLSNVVWQKRTSPDARKKISAGHEYLLMYSRDYENRNDAINLLPITDEQKKAYKNPDNDPRGPWVSSDFTAQIGHATPQQFYTIIGPNGQTHTPPQGTCWKNIESVYKQKLAEGRFWFGKNGDAFPRRKTYLNESKGRTAWSWWTNKDVGHTQEASKELKTLFDAGNIFDNPKPVRLIDRLLKLASKNDSIILDFFSGSSSLAHAVLNLNAEDKGARRFIQVQISEQTDEKSEAFKAGYKNICEIGKERIRRAAKKIKEETGTEIDYGFRVYRLDESNIQDVYYKPQDYDQTNLDLFADNVKSDRTADDLLAQVMLDWGLPLSLKIEQTTISDKKVFKVAENSLYACFDSGIDEDFAKAIATNKPLRIVFKDSAFKNDTAKTNVKQLLKQLSPETEMKVL